MGGPAGWRFREVLSWKRWTGMNRIASHLGLEFSLRTENATQHLEDASGVIGWQVIYKHVYLRIYIHMLLLESI